MLDPKEECQVCHKKLRVNGLSEWCSPTCRNDTFVATSITLGHQYMALPTIELPLELVAQLPLGRERQWLAFRHMICQRAPAAAVGYRVATYSERGQRLRWSPPSSSREVAMFLLEPFELPMVAYVGLYVLSYYDRSGVLISEPTFTIQIGFRDRHLRFSDGDLSMHPRRRKERRVRGAVT